MIEVRERPFPEREVDLFGSVVGFFDFIQTTRMLVDVLQECARHVGHMDIVRELVDGATGE